MAVPKILFAKTNTGGAPALTGATPIDTVGLEVARYEGTIKEHEFDRNIIGNVPQSNVNPQASAEFSVEAAGSGTAGDVPLYGMLLKACGFGEVINAGTDVVYTWASTGHESADLWDMRYGPQQQVQEIHAAFSSLQYKMEAEDFPMFTFSMLGDYNQPRALIAADQTAIDGVDWSTWEEASPMTSENTVTLTLDGVSACTKSFEIDFGLEILYRNWANCKTSKITDIKPSGTIVVEAPDISVTNWFAKAESHTSVQKVVFALEHDSTAGRKVQIDAAEVQITSIEEGEDEGEPILTMGLSFLDVPEITFL